eukprot:comp11718_c0_seq1/m.6297 comp11718_c0_seq1/g.6297  ORF comp11718_c0_seq1/g.6297 comp11718_c0_seq1/m.6297 type:complete len:266 (-) comp11718_c0_seq1:86-883(-)
MKFNRPLSLLLLGALAFAGFARAEEDVSVETESEGAAAGGEKPAAGEEHVSEAAFEEGIFAGDHILRHPNLESHVLFTSTGNATEFVAGEAQYMLAGLRNTGKGYFLVESIEASIRYPQQWDFRLFNFTARPFQVVVPPGAVASVEFPFRPHESFENREYGLTVIVNYKDNDGKDFRHALFNSTVIFYEPKNYSEFQNAFLLVFAVAVVAVFTLGIRNAVAPKSSKVKRQRVEAPEQGTVTKAESNWLEGTNADMNKPKSPKRAK